MSTFLKSYPELSRLVILISSVEAGFDNLPPASPAALATELFKSIPESDLVLAESGLKKASELSHKDFMDYVFVPDEDCSEALSNTVDMLLQLPEREALEMFINSVWDAQEALRESILLGRGI
jgi:hypothetical protein